VDGQWRKPHGLSRLQLEDAAIRDSECDHDNRANDDAKDEGHDALETPSSPAAIVISHDGRMSSAVRDQHTLARSSLASAVGAMRYALDDLARLEDDARGLRALWLRCQLLLSNGSVLTQVFRKRGEDPRAVTPRHAPASVDRLAFTLRRRSNQ
jgi:hypothetical protein